MVMKNLKNFVLYTCNVLTEENNTYVSLRLALLIFNIFQEKLIFSLYLFKYVIAFMPIYRTN